MKNPLRIKSFESAASGFPENCFLTLHSRIEKGPVFLMTALHYKSQLLCLLYLHLNQKDAFYASETFGFYLFAYKIYSITIIT